MADLPAIPTEAVAPLDYSSAYGRVAETMGKTGQALGKMFEDFAVFERTKDKERMRVEALNELYNERPHMKKVVRADISLEDLGKGLAQLHQGTILYGQVKQAGATPPDKEQFEQAVFMASPTAFKALVTNWEKIAGGAETAKASQEQFSGMQKTFQELKAKLGRDPTREELYQGSQVSPEKLGTTGAGMAEKLATPEATSERLAISKAQLSVARQRLRQVGEKLKKDTTFQEFNTLFRTAVANNSVQNARQILRAKASDLDAEAKVLEEKGMADAAEKKAEAADAMMDAFNYSAENAGVLQDLASDLGAYMDVRSKVITPPAPGAGPAPAPAPAPAPGGAVTQPPGAIPPGYQWNPEGYYEKISG
jgi:hypothetical protein